MDGERVVIVQAWSNGRLTCLDLRKCRNYVNNCPLSSAMVNSGEDDPKCVGATTYPCKKFEPFSGATD